jgi:hypothetical protein
MAGGDGNRAHVRDPVLARLRSRFIDADALIAMGDFCGVLGVERHHGAVLQLHGEPDADVPLSARRVAVQIVASELQKGQGKIILALLGGWKRLTGPMIQELRVEMTHEVLILSVVHTGRGEDAAVVYRGSGWLIHEILARLEI